MNIIRKKYIPAIAIILSLLFLMITGLYLFLEMTSEREIIEVDSRTLIVQKPRNENAIHFAVTPVLSPEKAYVSYMKLTSYLSECLKRPVILVQRKTYLEINELMKRGTVDAGILCTGAYLTLREEIPLALISVPVYPWGSTYFSYIIVRKESPFKKISDLENHRFSYSDPLSLSGFYYPVWYLLQQGYNPKEFFLKTIFTYSHDGNIRAVLDGISDGAAVDSLIYDYEVFHNPLYKERVKIIHKSPPLGVNPVVASPHISPEVFKEIREVLLKMHESPAGLKVLKELGVKRFDTPSPETYNDAEKIVNRVRKFIKGKNENL